jgi:hypothetical protein
MNDAANQRTKTRRRTIFGGVIYEDGGQSSECSVSDISQSGVKVKSSLSPELGVEVDLKINKFNSIHRCSVAWVRDGEVGLEFLMALSDKDEEMSRLFKFSSVDS